MNQLSILAGALCLSVAASAVTVLVLREAPEERTPDAGTMDVGSLREELRAMRAETSRELTALREKVETQALRSHSLSRPYGADAGNRGAAEPSVEEALAAEAGATTPEEENAPLDLEATLARLIDPEIGWEESEELWKKVREAGLVEELLAAFEARAEADPFNPQVHSELGEAYGQIAALNGSSPEAGRWATKADAAYDKALELDDHHWEARFNKAISLSFWPAAFGKGGEAIRNFEVLLAQQSETAPSSEHAYTYYFLGNLYSQRGDMDRARELWSQGAQRFPGNKELQNQLRNTSK